ncbi:hypothetical protein M9435_006928 [Picochlorum sp. BPE23]|nr:hypothetical protein M9435_006928 [Picochlorum sp. BPE23]
MSRASIQQQQRVFPQQQQQQQIVSVGGLAGGSQQHVSNNNNNGSMSRQYTSVSPQHFDDAADIFPSFNCESGDLGDMLAREMGDGCLGRESSQRFPAWGDVSLSDMDMVPQCMPMGLVNSNSPLGKEGSGGDQMGHHCGGKEQHVVNGMPISYNNSTMMQPNMMMPPMVPSMQQIQMQQRHGMVQQPVRDNNDGSNTNQFGYYCSKEQQQYPQVPFPMQWYVNGPMMPYQCFATPIYFAAHVPPGVGPSSDSDSGQGTHFCSKRAMPQASSSSASKSSAKRMACVERYRKKKAKRSFKKHIRYQMRKDNADKRVRVKGRFARASP